MNKHRHLTQMDRETIANRLQSHTSFKTIARELGKDPTTISKEVKKHTQLKRSGCFGRSFNDCQFRAYCTVKNLCTKAGCNRYCSYCPKHFCGSTCSEYSKENCPKLSKPPYVCNGCPQRNACTLEKLIYSASFAHTQYTSTRTDSRRGLCLTQEELTRIDQIISPLLKQGQSLNHIYAYHADEIMLSQRSLYTYIDSGLFSARNLDMPKVVRMSMRKKTLSLKVDTKCRDGRTYEDFLNFLENSPGIPYVQMDSVIGRRGGKVLLTMHFVVPQLMLAFLRDANTARSVQDILNKLYLDLQPKKYRQLFNVLLGDNGSEFSNPTAFELDSLGQSRSKVFYCDPNSPYQKGAIENNHTLLRRILPQGTSFDDLTQDHISLAINHINSYTRPNLGNQTPYQVFASFYGEECLRKMGLGPINADEIILRPSLLK